MIFCFYCLMFNCRLENVIIYIFYVKILHHYLFYIIAEAFCFFYFKYIRQNVKCMCLVWGIAFVNYLIHFNKQLIKIHVKIWKTRWLETPQNNFLKFILKITITVSTKKLLQKLMIFLGKVDYSLDLKSATNVLLIHCFQNYRYF